MSFVGIFVEDTDTKAREFLRIHPLSFPTGHDWQLELAKPLGFRGMPYTVLISRQGEVAQRFFGPVSEDDFVIAIEALSTRR